MKDYAVKLVTRYDKNGDMMLGPEERKELRGPAADSDLNHDGTITVDELVAHLSNPSATASTAPSTSSSNSSTSSTSTSSNSSSDRDRDRGSYGYRRRDGESSSDRGKSEADKALAGRVFTGTAGGAASGKEGDKRRTYRFTRAADRVPTNVPSWFKSRDANGDGQVSMSEYSRSWSSSTVAEFRRYDLDDDGIITAKEAAPKK
jgi:Ca2+-binding EF-hand superfamily protein